MCGENFVFPFSDIKRLGSPPYVRGKYQHGLEPLEQLGLTPVCAGKIQQLPGPCLPIQAHPRMCGENFTLMRPVPWHMGSPPYVRGKSSNSAGCLGQPGLTPVCAGKMFLQYRRSFLQRAHPRMCGENAMNQAIRDSEKGSPPYVRGKYNLIVSNNVLDGLTPVRTGKISLSTT